jgi:hypothetical protein
LREGRQAMAEYQAKLESMREKTARLRALRLPIRRHRRPTGEAWPNTAKHSKRVPLKRCLRGRASTPVIVDFDGVCSA